MNTKIMNLFLVGHIFCFFLNFKLLAQIDNTELSGNLQIHDPSTIIKCNDKYWIFGTGRGIISKFSTNLKDWVSGPRVINTPPTWITSTVPENNGVFWAPDIVKVKGQYRLYYSVSSWGKNDSAIALVTNDTLDPQDPQYQWIDRGIVIKSVKTNNFNAIDPSIFIDSDDSHWMVFGSYWSGIKLIRLDPITGKRISPDSPMFALAWNISIEAPYIYKHENLYYLFVNWGTCAQGVNSTYNIRIGRSKKITGPYIDKDGLDMLHGGGSLFLNATNNFIGPGHAAILKDNDVYWFSFHYYDGKHNGRPTLNIRRLSWGTDGWPVLQ